ncbi:AzlC family ABC transporter permease, partial [Candidatus Stoquefichus massiliensis]|uniref:AzlC family ABC transporter permease n=1 Tax=Candidatus Stoquefichus massiliensis TaxID=1470350 RepID=UPI0005C97B79
MYKKVIKEAFIASIPVMMGYIVLGIAFGMLLESKGYSILYALLMSCFIYAGSMQFVAINLLTSGATLLSGALMTLLINARHMVYGLSMIKRFENMGKLKPYMIFSLTDETYSLLVGSK